MFSLFLYVCIRVHYVCMYVYVLQAHTYQNDTAESKDWRNIITLGLAQSYASFHA